MQRLTITPLALLVCAIVAGQTDAQALKPRKLAPGVVTVIRPQAEPADTFTDPFEMVEIVLGYPELDFKPNFAPKSETLLEKAKSTVYRREVWYLEFGFKPLRMIKAPVKMADGSVKERLVWYLAYYVKNNGNHLSPAAEADEFGNETFSVGTKSYPVRFTPNFRLHSLDRRKVYMDRVMPEAVERIRQREDAAIPFHDSVSIAQQPIPVDEKVWGIATWTGVDPKTDFIAIYVQGLTNAYKWVDKPGEFKRGDRPATGRKILQKTLKLNFWRPGDQYRQHEDEIRYGMPFFRSPEKQQRVLKIYRQQKRSDYVWIYQ